MALTRVDTGIQYFPQFAASRAIANAQIYIGEPGLDPAILANQLQAYIVQEDGMIVAVAQPIRTGAGGIPTYNGSAVQIGVMEAEFSIKVLDSGGSQVYYMPTNANNPANTGVPLPDSVGEEQLQDDSISTNKYQDDSIPTEKLKNDSVTFDKTQNINPDSILGRTASGVGNIEVHTPGQISRLLPSKIQPIAATVALNALTLTLNPTTLDFRSATLSSGAVATRVINPALTLVVPNGATLGALNSVRARLALLAIDNAGTVELAVVNTAGGVLLNESGVISTTILDVNSDANNVIYSAAARTNVPFRVVGFVEFTQSTAGVYASAPSLVQGMGGLASSSVDSILNSGSVPTTSGTLFDVANVPAFASRVTFVFRGVSTNGVSPIQVQLGTVSGFVSTGYANVLSAGNAATTFTSGFVLNFNGLGAANTQSGSITLRRVSGNVWVADSIGGNDNTGSVLSVGVGNISLASLLTQLRVSTVGGADVFDAGEFNVFYE